MHFAGFLQNMFINWQLCTACIAEDGPNGSSAVLNLQDGVMRD